MKSISRSELVKLQQKIIAARNTPVVMRKDGAVTVPDNSAKLERIAKAERYAKLVLRRHGVKDMKIDPQTGRLIANQS